MKKWIVLLLVFSMLLSLAACKKAEEQTDAADSLADVTSEPETEIVPETEIISEPEPQTEPEPEPAPEPEPEPEQIYRNQLTGEICDEETAKARVIGFMVNNVNIGQQRVQTGVAHADVIIESYIEFLGTRLLALYKDIEGVGQIGTLRSARIDFAKIAHAFDALYIHVGEDRAYCTPFMDGVGMDDLCYQQTFRNNDTGYEYWFYQDNGLAGSENWLYTTDERTLQAIADNGYRMTTEQLDTWVGFTDEENSALAAGEDCSVIHAKFNRDQISSFHYDAELGLYERWTRGEQVKDYKDGELTYVKNVFVLATDVGLYPDNLHADISLEGGSGYYASEGKVVPILWSTDETGMFVFTLEDGSELPVNVGKSYICLHSDDYETTWE